ncbi:MAG: hypothetical protein EOM25_13025 [Deltaproteobacteria bacterium]|nr:hypothetical protein [Deltaproteobacteria bacterium]
MNIHSMTGDEGRLRFVSWITAMATHDMKNVLAIINENAGLLQDLCLLAERGTLSPDRLADTNVRIRDQVRRGDVLLRNLNELAHSQDQEAMGTDIGQAAELAVALVRRMTASFQAEVMIEKDSSEPSMTVRKFDLLRLLAACLMAGGQHVGKGGVVRIQVTAAPVGYRITCPVSAAEDADICRLARECGAALHWDGGSLSISLTPAIVRGVQ